MSAQKFCKDHESIVKESLTKFLQDNVPDANLSYIDDIVLSYVVSILEELGTETANEETFDVESFSEMLSAYFPDFASVSHATICEWMFELSNRISDQKREAANLAAQAVASLTLPQPTTLAANRRSPRVSECSEISVESQDSYVAYDVDRSENINLLLEMFPGICQIEAAQCLALSNGSVSEAVQLVLQRQEDGLAISATPEVVGIPQTKSKTKNPESLKKKIIEKYSYVDQDDDKREHRPPPVKTEPKKLVRYLDNKVVSVKGERYTEIKDEKDDKEEMKKTYVSLKPARQYRFH